MGRNVGVESDIDIAILKYRFELYAPPLWCESFSTFCLLGSVMPKPSALPLY